MTSSLQMDNKLILKGVSASGRCPDSSPNLLLCSSLMTSSSKLPADDDYCKNQFYYLGQILDGVLCHWESPCLPTALSGIVEKKKRIWQQSS